MDCSMCEASRKEQSIALKHAFFGPIGNGLSFCKPKNGFFGVS